MAIPEGLVFFGTINIDETTHAPSPKFLDRSLTVQVSSTELPQDLPRLSNPLRQEEFWALSLQTVKHCASAGNSLGNDATQTWTELMKWNKTFLKPLGVHLSHRLPQVFRCYFGAASVLKISEHQQVADTFVLSKIMPLIAFLNDEGAETSTMDIETPTTKTEASPKKLKKDILQDWLAHDSTVNFPLVRAALKTMLNRNGMVVRYLE